MDRKGKVREVNDYVATNHTLLKKNGFIQVKGLVKETEQTPPAAETRKISHSDIIHGYYINLHKRTDRRMKMEQRLLPILAEVRRFEAIDAASVSLPAGYIRSKAQYACKESQLAVLKLARERNLPQVMILEDDVVFCDDFNDRLDLFFKTVPSDWQIIYMGVNIGRALAPVSENIHRVTEAYGCFGYIVRHSMYDRLIELWTTGNDTCDDLIADYIQPKYPCYVFTPYLVYVENDYSDIVMRYRDDLSFISSNYKPRLNYTAHATIPKIIHQIWLGDQGKRPQDMMNTWKEKNPGWHYKLWTEKEVEKINLKCKEHYESFGNNYVGKSDILRYEILFRFGGIFMDADATCLQALPDEMVYHDSWAVYELDSSMPGYLANGYMGATKGNRLIGLMIQDIFNMESVTYDDPWISVGTKYFTDFVQKQNYQALHVYPTYQFMPVHHTGAKSTGPGIVYAEQGWHSTKELAKKWN
ncbi:MAG: glycosyltransferase [Sphingobacteriales bacterium]